MSIYNDFIDTTPSASFKQQSWDDRTLSLDANKELSWQQFNYQCQLISQSRKHNKGKPNDLCGHWFYNGECQFIRCPKLHTRDINKIRAWLGQSYKTTKCTRNEYCSHFMCRFQHTPDTFIFNNTCTPEILQQWEIERDVAYRLQIARGEVRERNPIFNNFTVGKLTIHTDTHGFSL